MNSNVPLRVGDYVIPKPDEDEDPEFLANWDRLWTPCRVLNIYKNGSLRARSDDKRNEWRGPIDGFQLAGER